MRARNIAFAILVVLLVGGISFSMVQADETKQTAAENVVKAVAGLMETNPALAMDPKADVWGDYFCIHLTKGVTNMIHFAADPSQDDADIVMLVHAKSFIDMGLQVDKLPQLSKPPFGPGLTSGQWHYIPKFQLLALPVRAEDAGIKGSIVPKGS